MSNPATDQPIDRLSTPFVLLDGREIEANLARAADYARESGLSLRPHTKTHKMRPLAERQLEHGAAGLTVAKLDEARVMADVANDLLLAYPMVCPARAQVLAELARDRTVRAIADGPKPIECLAHAASQAHTQLGILIDLDLGMRRTGVPEAKMALQLAQTVDQTPGLRLDGLIVYPGQVWAASHDQPAILAELNDRIDECLALWNRHGLSAPIVSGGSTPTLYQSHHMPALTEIRPGTYVFNDMNTCRGGFCRLEDCAATVICTVVSDATSGRVILDAGSKTLTSDRLLSGDGVGHGHILEYPAAVIEGLSEEHGHVNVGACDDPPSVGRRVSVVPNHVCPCINLHTTVWWTEDRIRARPVNVDARGCVR